MSYDALFSLYEGSLVAGGNPTCGQTGGTHFLGLLMGQNQHALVAFDTLFKVLQGEGSKVARIIDLGTSHGGLAVFLQLYASTCGATVITWDRTSNVPQHGDLLNRLGTVVRTGDILADPVVQEEIRSSLRSEGLSILLCDNGDKKREVSLFAPSLKVGDLLLAHDYAPDEEGHRRLGEGCWSSWEISDADVEPVRARYGFVPFLQDVFLLAAWLCMRRTSNGAEKDPLAQAPVQSSDAREVRVEKGVPTFGRRDSLLRALQRLETIHPGVCNIVETGTLRNDSESGRSGDGWSTVAWGWYAAKTGSRVWTVDIDAGNIEVCRRLTREYAQRIEYVVSDSVQFLRKWPEQAAGPIHLLYLDSFDYIDRPASEAHCLREAEAALPSLAEPCLVLFDDTTATGDTSYTGKGTRAVPFLIEHGFQVIGSSDGQVLLTRDNTRANAQQ